MKKNLLLLISIVFIVASTQAQSVTTFAGIAYSGTGQYNSETVKTDKRYFSAPYGVLVDTAVNLIYVSQEHSIIAIQYGNCYNRSGNSGDPSFSLGYKDATGIAAKYSRPAGMALTKDRHVIIADQNNSLVRHLWLFMNSSNNSPSKTIAGQQSFLGGYNDGANVTAKFGGLQDVAVIGDDIYVADKDNHCIRKISNGITSTIVGDATTSGTADGIGTAAQFYLPSGIYAESNTSLLVADFGNNSIRRVNLTNNTVSTVVTGLEGPRDMVKVNGKIYIADWTCVQVYDGTRLAVYAGSRTQNGNVDAVGTKARFKLVTSIDYNPKEEAFYVVDQGLNVVKKISSSLPPVADFITSTQSASVGQTVILKNTSTNNPTGFEWSITPNSYTLELGSTLKDSIVYVNFTAANSYSISLTASNAEGSDKVTKSNHISVSTSSSSVTVAGFEASNTSPEIGQTVILVDLSSHAPSAWDWTITPSTGFTYVDGTNSNSQYPKIQFSTNGTYSVKLVVTNINGTDTEEKLAYINSKWPLSQKTVPNLDFAIYPNPVKDMMKIEGEFNAFNNRIEILAIDGSLIKSTSNSNSINLSELPTGIYFVKVLNDSKVGIKKIYKN